MFKLYLTGIETLWPKLVLMSRQMFKLYLTGIETCLSMILHFVRKLFKLYLTGIETLLELLETFRGFSSNCTLLELKHHASSEDKRK